VITDIQMPIMDGLELLESIREKKSQTIVIITTAFGTENYAIQALQLGANNYLKKPVRGTDLIPLLKKYQSVIDNKFNTDALPGKLISKRFSIEFKSTITGIPKIVDRILIESDCNFQNSERINVELGLVEIITNAVEHGNLEISYQEKKSALDAGNIEELFASKLSDPIFRDRKIIVDYKKDQTGCEWIITDEGHGFDWRELPDPTHEQNILDLNGRGVFISNFLFDEIEYYGKGNIVRVRKNNENKEFKS
jgi:CheY-like chemotaxis protein